MPLRLDFAAALLLLPLWFGGWSCTLAGEGPTPQPAAPTAQTPTAFVDVHLVPMDHEGTLPHQTLVVREGRIAAIGPTAETPVPEDAHVIAGQGRYLMPGLADMHVHLFDRNELLMYLANGITTVRNLHGIARHLLWRDSLAAGTLAGPRLFTSGPILDGDPPTRGTNTVLRTPEDAAREVHRQHQAGYDFIKIYDNVSPELYEALLTTAREVGLPVVGHLPTPVGLDGVLARRGQAAIEHIEELMPFLNIEQEPAGMEATARALAEAGIWLDPTLVVYAWPFRQTDPALFARPAWRYLNPATAQTWGWATAPTSMPPEALQRGARRWTFTLAFTKAFHEAGGNLLAGSDAPIQTMIPGFSLIEELRAFVEAGLTPYEALVTATRNPAVFVGQPGAFGTLTVGASADLLLLAANPLADVDHTQQRIGVMARGHWWPEAVLRQRLEAQARSYEAR